MLVGESEHFTIFADTSERSTRKLIEQMELFRAAFLTFFPRTSRFAEEKVHVFIVYRNRTIDDTIPLDDKGKPSGTLAGYFSSGPNPPFIYIKYDSDSVQRQEVIYHEYVHFLASHEEREYPAWFVEGIAETFSLFDIRKEKIIFGKMPQKVSRWLADGTMDFDDFFTRNRAHLRSRKQNEMIARFYDQAQALVHYLHFGPRRAPISQIVAFAQNQLSGMTPEEAFADVFGEPLADFEREFESSIRSGYSYVYRDLPIEEISQDPKITLREATELEIELNYAHALIRSQRFNEARSHLLRASRIAPDDPQLLTLFGFLDLRQEFEDSAYEHFLQAVNAGTRNPYPYIAVARKQLEDLQRKRGQVSARDPDFVACIQLIGKAWSHDRRNRHIYQMMGRSMTLTDAKFAEATLKALTLGFAEFPDDPTITFDLAELLARSGEYEAARNVIKAHFHQKRTPNVQRRATEAYDSLAAQYPEIDIGEMPVASAGG